MMQAEVDLNQVQRALSASQIPGDKMQQWDLSKLERETLHRAAPYDFPELFEARRDVFIAAMKLHQAFVVAAWKPLSGSLSAFVNLLQGNLNVTQITKGPIHLWDAFFLVVPVVSTTFALCAKRGFEPQVVQEAQQASTLIGLTATGLGIALVPATLQAIAVPGVVFRTLDEPDTTTTLYIAHRYGDANARATQFVSLALGSAKTTQAD
ncbi:LysR substrate binding domain-containing protein [Paraburkholderia sp. BL23I1N1]|nr:LysR substrate binding domain-containing protein [Paraburkholderia sp. BL23I1N1]